MHHNNSMDGLHSRRRDWLCQPARIIVFVQGASSPPEGIVATVGSSSIDVAGKTADIGGSLDTRGTRAGPSVSDQRMSEGIELSELFGQT